MVSNYIASSATWRVTNLVGDFGDPQCSTKVSSLGDLMINRYVNISPSIGITTVRGPVSKYIYHALYDSFL